MMLKKEEVKHLIPFGLLVLAFLVRLPKMGESVWYDETTVSLIYLKDIPSLIYFIFGQATHPPLHFISYFFWIQLFGDSPIVLRIPVLLYGMGSLYVAYLLFRKIFSESVGLLVLLLLSFSPVHVWYSAEARMYAAALFFNLLTFYSWIQYEETGKRKWFFWYSIASLLFVFHHIYAVAFLLLISVLVLISSSEQKAKLLSVNFLIIGIFSIYFLFKNSLSPLVTGYYYLRAFTLFEAWLLFTNWFPTGNCIDPIFPFDFSIKKLMNYPTAITIQFFYSILLIIGITAIIRSIRKKNLTIPIGVMGFCFIIPISLFILNLLGKKESYIERSVIFSLPFYFGIIAFGLNSLKTKKVKNILIVLVLSIHLLSLIFMFYRNDLWTVMDQKPNWKGIVQYFQDEMKSETDQIVILTPKFNSPIKYYDQRFYDRDHMWKENQIYLFIKKINSFFRP